MQPVRSPNAPIRRRPREATPEAPPEQIPAPAPIAAPVAEAEPIVASRPFEKPQERNLPARGSTDFADLKRVAEMDRAEVHALLAQFSQKAPSARLRRGQRVQGRITRLSSSTAFLDVGSKADATLDRQELPSTVQVGDTIQAFVLSSPMEGEIRLTLVLSGDAAVDMLEEARQSRIPIEGLVSSMNEHGFEIKIGSLRGFCPMAQLDLPPISEPASYVGRSLSFRVLEVKGKDAILSHRVIAEEQAAQESARRLSELREGDVYDGQVVRLRDFGAFVRLSNGVEGLVHLSNISRQRIKHPSDVLKEGQEVMVQVLNVDSAAGRLNLGIRQVERSASSVSSTQGEDLRPADRQSFGTMASLLKGWKK